MKLRPSYAPVSTRCGQSVIPPRIPLDLAGDPARSGSAGHEIFPRIVRGEDADVESTAMVHGVKASEQSFLRSQAWRIWNQSPNDETPALKAFFPDPILEERIEWVDGEFELGGTPDLISLVELPDGLFQIRALDWKTGRTDHSAFPQLMMYVLIYGKLMQAMGKRISSVWFVTARVRDGAYDPSEIIPWEVVERWWERLKIHLKSGRYSPGDHCSMCNRYWECEAAAIVLQHGLRLAGQVDSYMDRLPEDPKLRGPMLADAVNKARFLEREVGRFLAMAKTDVEAHGVEMDEFLYLKPENTKSIVTEKALPVLRAHLSEEAIIEAAKLGNGKIEEALGKVAPKRGKGKLVKQVWEELAAAGAVETKTSFQLKVRNHDSSNDAERIENAGSSGEASIIGIENGGLQALPGGRRDHAFHWDGDEHPRHENAARPSADRG